MTLEEAIKQISKRHFDYQLPIQMIGYEDGSGNKFIYKLKNEKENRFVDLTYYKSRNEFVNLYEKAAEIMGKWK